MKAVAETITTPLTTQSIIVGVLFSFVLAIGGSLCVNHSTDPLIASAFYCLGLLFLLGPLWEDYQRSIIP